MMKKSLGICICLFFSYVVHAQGDKEVLQNIFKNMSSQYTEQETEKVFFMSYSLHTVHLDTLEKPTDVTIEVWKKNSLVEIKSAQMNVYQDLKETFIMLPDKHMIMRNDATLRKQDQASVNKNMGLYDSLLNYSQIVDSQIQKFKKEYDRKISIAVNEKGQQLFKIKKADYFINTETKTIKKVRVYYTDQTAALSKIAYVDYIINDMQEDYQGKKLSAQVASIFLNGDKLKNTYKDYKLVDNRAVVHKRERYQE
ncbi:MAG TPA: hypothetical protein VFF27_12290 [Bacteroidia bacterium]|jgi:hypothetical protein|nr:hypothetical protein [Bacteroidia bacterium]